LHVCLSAIRSGSLVNTFSHGDCLDYQMARQEILAHEEGWASLQLW